MFRVAPLVIVLLLLPGAAMACPLCSTATGEAVRAGIADNFTRHLFATLAPFPVLLAIVALVGARWPDRGPAS